MMGNWKKELGWLLVIIWVLFEVLIFAMQMSTHSYVKDERTSMLNYYLVKDDGWTVEIRQLFTLHDFTKGVIVLEYKYIPGKDSLLSGPDDHIAFILIFRQDGEWNTACPIGDIKR